jgi:hypothetical protein
MKEHFSVVVSEIAKAFPDVRASRFGLRFINGRAQSRSATFCFGMMLHGEVLRAVESI